MLASTWESSAIQLRFAPGTDISTADPSVGSTFSFLTVESKTASYEDSGTVLLTVQYTGAGFSQYGGDDGDILTLEAQPKYRLDGRLRELAFSDHPKFRVLSQDEQISINAYGDGGYRWLPEAAGSFSAGLYYDNGAEGLSAVPSYMNVTSADGIAFMNKVARGETTYQAPTLTWTEYTQGEAGMTPQQLGKLGEISTPRGNPPTISGYDWLLTSASEDRIGQLFQTTLQWTLSTPDGWDAFLYTNT